MWEESGAQTREQNFLAECLSRLYSCLCDARVAVDTWTECQRRLHEAVERRMEGKNDKPLMLPSGSLNMPKSRKPSTSTRWHNNCTSSQCVPGTAILNDSCIDHYWFFREYGCGNSEYHTACILNTSSYTFLASSVNFPPLPTGIVRVTVIEIGRAHV